jgi:hypothetical protein
VRDIASQQVPERVGTLVLTLGTPQQARHPCYFAGFLQALLDLQAPAWLAKCDE